MLLCSHVAKSLCSHDIIATLYYISLYYMSALVKPPLMIIILLLIIHTLPSDLMINTSKNIHYVINVFMITDSSTLK